MNVNKPYTSLGLIIFACLFLTLQSCKHNHELAPDELQGHPLFSLLPSRDTHIDFQNTLKEDAKLNVLQYEYFYNGGGVACGDLNGDGLPELYFTANMGPNKLYLNEGHLSFRDITSQTDLAGRPGGWKTGVTMADVNGDGKLDIYLCYSGKNAGPQRANQLFINQGNDKNGVPKFKEQAQAYGLADTGYSTQAVFFDYDGDGDLDMFLLKHAPAQLAVLDNSVTSMIRKQKDSPSGVRLFRNDGGHFTNVTAEAGISSTDLTYGLGAGVSDVNGDGLPDIYISNDYSAPDFLYINNGNGTFTNKLQTSLGHTSQFSMGNNISDINNDGRPDIMTLDMIPEDNHRQKLLFAPDNYEKFEMNRRSGFYYQYMRNMLHINNGDGTFSEIGQLAGISNTDWSWAPLFADYDNDGWKDLFVTNGFTRDFTNMDFLKYMGDVLRDHRLLASDVLSLVQQMPSSEIKSYLFKNNGNLTFSNQSTNWGIDKSSNSNGVIYADLDNDGDLDLVVNNINQEGFVYENHARELLKNHFLDLRLKGSGKNTQGIGARVTIYQKGALQFLEQMPSRGFQSSVSPQLHFGLGKSTSIDSLVVVWPSQKMQKIVHPAIDCIFVLDEHHAGMTWTSKKIRQALYMPVAAGLNAERAQGGLNDFKRQPLLINPLSFQGPCLASADVNGDGLADIFVGAGNSVAGSLFIQQPGGTYQLSSQPAFQQDKMRSDADALFFDANGDGKPDLYVASGGYNQFAPADSLLGDRLYLNDGKGNFKRLWNALPNMWVSKSCVRVADLNGDGKPDLFIGGRVIPGRYPESPRSYILINDGKGHFTDQTAILAPELLASGMVTDALWIDMNSDHHPDLVVVGDWMPISVYINHHGHLQNESKNYFSSPYYGWWNKIISCDFNHDGRPDFVVAGQGLNTQCRASTNEPAELFYGDFDKNGSVDPILCMYNQHKSYPYVTRDELLDQMSMMRTRFTDYKSYADASISEVLTPEELKSAKHLVATHLSSTLFLSNSHGQLHAAELPIQAQFSPAYTLTALDYNSDRNTDLLICGNITQARLRFGKSDANYGILLKGDGHGHFSYVPQTESGFSVWGDVRSVLEVNHTLYFGMSQEPIKAYRQTTAKLNIQSSK